MKTNVFNVMERIRRDVIAEIERNGMPPMVIDHAAFSIRALSPPRRGRDTAGYTATCHAVTRGGLNVPLELLFTLDGGGIELDHDAAVAAIIETLRRLEHGAERHEKRKADLAATIGRDIVHARSLGVEFDLVRIEERPIDVLAPDEELTIYFDVALSMLNEHDLKSDVCVMDAADDEEFSSYLRNRIIPEQQAIHARLDATVPAHG